MVPVMEECAGAAGGEAVCPADPCWPQMVPSAGYRHFHLRQGKINLWAEVGRTRIKTERRFLRVAEGSRPPLSNPGIGGLIISGVLYDVGKCSQNLILIDLFYIVWN